MSDDLVIAVMLDGKTAKPYPKALAKEHGLQVLKDEPLIVRGRIRSPFRVDGRPNKPKRSLKPAKAIPTPTATEGGESADKKE